MKLEDEVRILRRLTGPAAVDRARVVELEETVETMKSHLDRIDQGSTRDSERLDKLQAVAARRGCGWMVERRRPPELKHQSQEPAFWTIREAIDAMEDEPDAA